MKTGMMVLFALFDSSTETVSLHACEKVVMSEIFHERHL
jgi:hypothetical protein